MNTFKLASFICLLDLLLTFSLKVDARSFKRGYFTSFFGNLHKASNSNGIVLTTLYCGFPLKVYLTKKNNNWLNVKVGHFVGYIKKYNYSEKRPRCFQDIYPEFMNQINLSIEEIYWFGRLNDKFRKGVIGF